jgi:hypothetical protein
MMTDSCVAQLETPLRATLILNSLDRPLILPLDLSIRFSVSVTQGLALLFMR